MALRRFPTRPIGSPRTSSGAIGRSPHSLTIRECRHAGTHFASGRLGPSSLSPIARPHDAEPDSPTHRRAKQTHFRPRPSARNEPIARRPIPETNRTPLAQLLSPSARSPDPPRCIEAHQGPFSSAHRAAHEATQSPPSPNSLPLIRVPSVFPPWPQIPVRNEPSRRPGSFPKRTVANRHNSLTGNPQRPLPPGAPEAHQRAQPSAHRGGKRLGQSPCFSRRRPERRRIRWARSNWSTHSEVTQASSSSGGGTRPVGQLGPSWSVASLR